MLKHGFENNAAEYLRHMVNVIAFKPLPLYLAPLENLLVGITGALGTKESHFLKAKNLFSENAVEYLRHGECYSFQTFAFGFNIPENLLVAISGALGMIGSHFWSKNGFWEQAVRYLRNGEG